MRDSDYLLALFFCLSKNTAIIFIVRLFLTQNFQTHNEKAETLLGDIPLQEKLSDQRKSFGSLLPSKIIGKMLRNVKLIFKGKCLNSLFPH